ncbi:MAG: hypothetical protein ABH877_05235 [bacterium]
MRALPHALRIALLVASTAVAGPAILPAQADTFFHVSGPVERDSLDSPPFAISGNQLLWPVGSGVYSVRIESGTNSATRRVTLLR